MSYDRPMHTQQLPTTMSAAWLIMVVVFILFVIVPGGLTFLSLLVSTIFHLM